MNPPFTPAYTSAASRFGLPSAGSLSIDRVHFSVPAVAGRYQYDYYYLNSFDWYTYGSFTFGDYYYWGYSGAFIGAYDGYLPWYNGDGSYGNYYTTGYYGYWAYYPYGYGYDVFGYLGYLGSSYWGWGSYSSGLMSGLQFDFTLNNQHTEPPSLVIGQNRFNQWYGTFDGLVPMERMATQWGELIPDESRVPSHYGQADSDVPGLPGTLKPTEIDGPQKREANPDVFVGLEDITTGVVDSSREGSPVDAFLADKPFKLEIRHLPGGLPAWRDYIESSINEAARREHLKTVLRHHVAGIRSNHERFIYFEDFGLENFFDAIDESIPSINGVSDNQGSTSAVAEWGYILNRLYLSGTISSTDDAELLHEMTHMLDDFNGWYIGLSRDPLNLSKIEGLGYAAGHIVRSLARLQAFERNVKAHFYADADAIDNAWRLVWMSFFNNYQALDVTYATIFHRKLREEDFIDFENKTHVDVSHGRVYQKYYDLVQQYYGPSVHLRKASVDRPFQ